MAASTTWPATGSGGLQHGARQAEREQQASAAEVAEQRERRHRRFPAAPDHGEGAAERDVVDVAPGRLSQRTRLAPAGHPAVDEARVSFETGGGTDAEPFGDAGTEAFEEGVGAFGQAEDDLRAVGMFEVDRDRSAAAAKHVEPRFLVLGSAPPCRVERSVDPNDVRPHVGQQHPGEWARADAGQFDDAVPMQRTVHRQGPGRASATRRAGVLGPSEALHSRQAVGSDS